MMTGRERLLATFRREAVDRLPWSLCMDGYFTSSLPQQGYNMDLLQTLRFLKNDIMERHVPIFRLVSEGVERACVERGGERLNTLTTPVGQISERHVHTGQTWYLKKPYITNLEDAKVYGWICEHSRYEPDFEPFLREDALIGEDGLATPSGPLTPIQQLLQHLCRIENTVYLMEDEPEEMAALLAAIHRLNLSAYRIMAESPAPVVFTYEDTSTTVMSKRMYLEYSAPQLDEYADILHRAGKCYIVHMCGKLRGFAGEVGAGRMDGIDSLCPPTTGDFWAHEARTSWPDKIIIGGLEPPYLQRASQEQALRYAVDVVNRMAPGKGFILSSGDAVSYATPIGNLSLIARLVERYGALPLSGQIDPDEAVDALLRHREETL